jgi:prepilin signal peptidase PulO-like enzyme (type II secretory pathway)
MQTIFPMAMLWMMFYPPARVPLWIGVPVLIFLAVIGVIDYEYRVVLFQTSVVGALICFVAGTFLHGLWITLAGGAIGFVIMLSIYYMGVGFTKLMAKIRKTEYSDVALGFGDVTLSGILGLVLGWPGITLGLLTAILLGGLASAIYLVFSLFNHKYRITQSIPYAPFLVIGTIILLFRP